MSQEKRDARIKIRLRLMMQDGVSEMEALTEELIAKIKEARAALSDDSKFESARREACKAFEALYRKSGALEAAAESMYAYTGSGSVVQIANFKKFRAALGVFAGAARESTELVIGKQVLSVEGRFNEAVELLQDLLLSQKDLIPHNNAYTPAELKKNA